MVGFILKLLRDKGLLPELGLQIENIVCALDVDLQGAAATVARILRDKRQTVDLVLENKPLKWYNIRAAHKFNFSLFLQGIFHCKWINFVIWNLFSPIHFLPQGF